MSQNTDFIEAVTELVKQALKLWLGDEPDPPTPPNQDSHHKPAG